MTDGLQTHDRAADLVLARLHLRLGSLALARAELETLAGRDGLDDDGLVDLAEARWRTGDLDGAGEAAVAALRDEDGPLLALVVAAEAAAARGRPSESRRLAERALAATTGSIDAIFAGMPRASVWPPDAAAPPPAATTMFGPPHGPPADDRDPAAGTSERAEASDAALAAVAADDPASIELWADGALDDATVTTEPEPGPPDAGAELPFGDEELERGRAALAAGDLDRAALHLSLVLRLTPALAPIVVEIVEARSESGLALVRGDAYRLVGRESDAFRAYADVTIPDPDPDPDPDPPTGDPT